MGRGDPARWNGWVLVLAAAPAVLQAGERGDRAPAPVPEPPDPGLLEFLAEEPALDDELGKALMTGDLDGAIDRTVVRGKVVKDDGKEPQ